MINKNIRIAKELVKLAKSLVAWKPSANIYLGCDGWVYDFEEGKDSNGNRCVTKIRFEHAVPKDNREGSILEKDIHEIKEWIRFALHMNSKDGVAQKLYFLRDAGVFIESTDKPNTKTNGGGAGGRQDDGRGRGRGGQPGIGRPNDELPGIEEPEDPPLTPEEVDDILKGAGATKAR